MSPAVLIDYGCHSFSWKLALRLHRDGFGIRYFGNGSLESPNLKSLAGWVKENPELARSINCRREYGKMSLADRLRGEYEWAGQCIRALEAEKPSVVIVSCVPLTVVSRIQSWTERNGVPMIYWLQDLQGRAVHDLLGRKFGFAGKVLGSIADIWEQGILERSRMIITIAAGHEMGLPAVVRNEGRYALLENWANIDEFPALRPDNDWAVAAGLDRTRNVVYSGTLGFKHDLAMFTDLAEAVRDQEDVRVVIVSSGQAADHVAKAAMAKGLSNLVVLPFQPYGDVPKVLASASVLVAPLDPSAGSFCVPSKVLSYLCAGRPVVIAIDSRNPAARMIYTSGAGSVVRPGDTTGFVASVRELLQNPGKMREQGRAARTYAELTFNIDSIVQRFLRILDSADVDLRASTSPGNHTLQAQPSGASLNR